MCIVVSEEVVLRRGLKGVLPREGGMPLMPEKGVGLRLKGVEVSPREGPRDIVGEA